MSRCSWTLENATLDHRILFEPITPITAWCLRKNVFLVSARWIVSTMLEVRIDDHETEAISLVAIPPTTYTDLGRACH